MSQAGHCNKASFHTEVALLTRFVLSPARKRRQQTLQDLMVQVAVRITRGDVKLRERRGI